MSLPLVWLTLAGPPALASYLAHGGLPANLARGGQPGVRMAFLGEDDEAAKQAWLARQEPPSWGPAVAPAAKESVAESVARREKEVREASLGGFPEAIVESQEYRVQFKTTAGSFTVTLDRALSPNGVDRFVELVKDGHFTDMLFYRVLPGFLIQFGVAADPAQQRKWDYTLGPDGEKIWPRQPLADEPNRAKFRAGSISFAGAGENTRSCHLFIAMEPYGSKVLGSGPHETTIGYVDEGLDTRVGLGDGLEVMDRICRKHTHKGYPDTGFLQGALIEHGNAAAAEYPELDRIESAEMIE